MAALLFELRDTTDDDFRISLHLPADINPRDAAAFLAQTELALENISPGIVNLAHISPPSTPTPSLATEILELCGAVSNRVAVMANKADIQRLASGLELPTLTDDQIHDVVKHVNYGNIAEAAKDIINNGIEDYLKAKYLNNEIQKEETSG